MFSFQKVKKHRHEEPATPEDNSDSITPVNIQKPSRAYSGQFIQQRILQYSQQVSALTNQIQAIGQADNFPVIVLHNHNDTITLEHPTTPHVWIVSIDFIVGSDWPTLINQIITHIWEQGGHLYLITRDISFENLIKDFGVYDSFNCLRIKSRLQDLFGIKQRAKCPVATDIVNTNALQEHRQQLANNIAAIGLAMQDRFTPIFRETVTQYYPGVRFIEENDKWQIDASQLQSINLLESLAHDLQFRKKHTHIPLENAFCTLNNYEIREDIHRDLHMAMTTFVQASSGCDRVGIWLTGVNSIGKTHLAVGMAKAFDQQGFKTNFVMASAVKKFDCTKTNEDTVWVLDDFNKPDAELAKFVFELIECAYQKGGLVIVTSNVGPERFVDLAMIRNDEKGHDVFLIMKLKRFFIEAESIKQIGDMLDKHVRGARSSSLKFRGEFLQLVEGDRQPNHAIKKEIHDAYLENAKAMFSNTAFQKAHPRKNISFLHDGIPFDAFVNALIWTQETFNECIIAAIRVAYRMSLGERSQPWLIQQILSFWNINVRLRILHFLESKHIEHDKDSVEYLIKLMSLQSISDQLDHYTANELLTLTKDDLTLITFLRSSMAENHFDPILQRFLHLSTKEEKLLMVFMPTTDPQPIVKKFRSTPRLHVFLVKHNPHASLEARGIEDAFLAAQKRDGTHNSFPTTSSTDSTLSVDPNNDDDCPFDLHTYFRIQMPDFMRNAGMILPEPNYIDHLKNITKWHDVSASKWDIADVISKIRTLFPLFINLHNTPAQLSYYHKFESFGTTLYQELRDLHALGLQHSQVVEWLRDLCYPCTHAGLGDRGLNPGLREQYTNLLGAGYKDWNGWVCNLSNRAHVSLRDNNFMCRGSEEDERLDSNQDSKRDREFIYMNFGIYASKMYEEFFVEGYFSCKYRISAATLVWKLGIGSFEKQQLAFALDWNNFLTSITQLMQSEVYSHTEKLQELEFKIQFATSGQGFVRNCSKWCSVTTGFQGFNNPVTGARFTNIKEWAETLIPAYFNNEAVQKYYASWSRFGLGIFAQVQTKDIDDDKTITKKPEADFVRLIH